MKFLDPFSDGFRQFSRNGRWGTCGDCPRDSENCAYPEFCKNTSRYDHLLDVDGLCQQYKNRTAYNSVD